MFRKKMLLQKFFNRNFFRKSEKISRIFFINIFRLLIKKIFAQYIYIIRHNFVCVEVIINDEKIYKITAITLLNLNEIL